MGVGGLLPQPEMAEDAFDDIEFMNQADDFHLMAAAGTTERVHFPGLFYELTPGLGGYPSWPVLGHIQHDHLGIDLGSRRLIAGSQ